MARTGVSDCAGFLGAKLYSPTPFGTHRAFSLTPCHPSFGLRSDLFHRSALFLPAAAQVKKEASRKRQKGKNMKLEEVNTRTKEAVDFPSLQHWSPVTVNSSPHTSGEAMAKFHAYSFGNIMLIARQKPDASNVAGLRTWNSLQRRFVKRGEKGIFILAPMSLEDEAPAEGCSDRRARVKTPTTEGQRTLYGFRGRLCFRCQPNWKAKNSQHHDRKSTAT